MPFVFQAALKSIGYTFEGWLKQQLFKTHKPAKIIKAINGRTSTLT
ncbi:hypothetical protein [Xenorhabdus innexi]